MISKLRRETVPEEEKELMRHIGQIIWNLKDFWIITSKLIENYVREIWTKINSMVFIFVVKNRL